MNNKKTKERALSEKSTKEVAIPEKILEELPPDDRRKVSELFVEMKNVSGIMGSAVHLVTSKFLDKCESEHISEIIANAEKNNVRIAEDLSDSRRVSFRVFLISIIAFLMVCGIFLFTKNQDILFKLIEFLVVAAGAGFGGWGLAIKKLKE